MSLLKEITKIKKEDNFLVDSYIKRELVNLKKELEPDKKEMMKQEIHERRNSLLKAIETIKLKKNIPLQNWVKTGIPGFDSLLEKGIPRGTSTLVAGGAGSGKTIFLLQIMNYVASMGKKAIYISLEESEERLRKHMHDFNWNPEKYEKRGAIKIIRIDPFEISRGVEALLSAAKGELKMNIAELGEIIPKDFKPAWVFIDSLTALAAAFREDTDNYRIYIEQLFRYFEKQGVTSFLVSETEQIPTKFSKSGVEEFLADAVVVLYHIKRGNIREHAIEVLKLRGAKHQNKIVAMKIMEKKGIVIYPEQEVFGGIKEE